MPWNFRPARPDDVEHVIELWRQAEPAFVGADTEKQLRELIAYSPDALILAEAGRELVGSIIAGFDGFRGTLYRLAVAPAWRRRGLARDLLNEAERRLIAKGASPVFALVESDHDLAVAFWDASGYEGVPRITPYFTRIDRDQS